MIIFYLVAVTLILAYLGYTIIRFREIPVSISNTYYMWKDLKMEWLFTFTMWIVAIAIAVYWLTEAELYRCQFLCFTSVAGMGFVGGAAMFKETLTKATHYISAGLWAGSAILFFAINGMFLPLWIGTMAGLVGLISNKWENTTFWLEIAVIVAMIFGIALL